LQIAMSILESILHDEVARGVICTPDCNLVMDVVKMLSYLVRILTVYNSCASCMKKMSLFRLPSGPHSVR